MLGLREPNSTVREADVLLSIENCVVDLHEDVAADEQVFKVWLPDVESANSVLAGAGAIFWDSLDPMARRNGIFNTIDHVSKVTEGVL